MNPLGWIESIWWLGIPTALLLGALLGADLVDATREVLGVEAVGEDSLSEQDLRDIWTEAESWSVEEAISYRHGRRLT